MFNTQARQGAPCPNRPRPGTVIYLDHNATTPVLPCLRAWETRSRMMSLTGHKFHAPKWIGALRMRWDNAPPYTAVRLVFVRRGGLS